MATAPTARRAWYHFKVWAAVKDVPEVAILGVLCTAVIVQGTYTTWREYFTPAGDSFPRPSTRHSIDAQLAKVSEEHNPSLYYKLVKALGADEKGFEISLPFWSNKGEPYQYNKYLATPGVTHSGASAAGSEKVD